MKFSRFLFSKIIPLCILFFGLILWNIFAVSVGVKAIVTAITDVGVFVCAAVWLAAEYYRVNNRLKKLRRLCEEVKEGYLLGEILPRPANAAEEEYFTVMKFVSHAAVDNCERLLREQEEYRDYVEGWIHEIKTPLTACSLILSNGGDARKLKVELKRAENLTEQILYCARLRTLENDIKITEISVRDAVDEAVRGEMELLLAAKVRVEANGDFKAYTDKQSLAFVLKQLLVNASKYCPHCRVDILLKNGSCTVRDDGPGIPAHELPRVFSRGFVGELGRKKGGGTGMGLFLAHELCARLGIDLEVKSQDGAVFILTFPSVRPASSRHCEAVQPPRQSPE